MVGATDNAGMWEGLGITQSQKDRQIKHLSFSQIKDANRLNLGSVTHRAHVGTLRCDHTATMKRKQGKSAKSTMNGIPTEEIKKRRCKKGSVIRKYYKNILNISLCV